MVPSIAEVVRQFKQNWTSQLEPQAIENACREAGLTWRDRLLNPVVTMQLFFLQILNGNTACNHLRHLARMGANKRDRSNCWGSLRFQGLFFHGRPRDRSVDSSPNFFAVVCTQSSVPNGWLRVTLRRIASNSPSVCG